jgi:hypothetical protein
MAPTKAYSKADIEGLLSSALGPARARTVVEETLARLGISATTPIESPLARRVLEKISESEGLVGVTGRVALMRFEVGRTHSSAAFTLKRRLEIVAGLLAPTLGKERADSLVREQARTLGLPEEIDLDQALVLLEHIAHIPGVTGIAARFAKTRINLNW